MITDKITFKAQKNAPSPKEVDYWIDTATDPNGGTIKYNNGKEWTQLNSKGDDNASTDEPVFDPHRKITAKYLITEEQVGTEVVLFNNQVGQDPTAITKARINGKWVDPSTVSFYKYVFDTAGEYIVEVEVKEGCIINRTFERVTNVKEVDFSNFKDKFDNFFQYLFNEATNVEKVCIKNAEFDCSNNIVFNYSFCKTSSLQELDMSGVTFTSFDGNTFMLESTFSESGLYEFDFNKIFKNAILPKRYVMSASFQGCTNLEKFVMNDMNFEQFETRHPLFAGCSNIKEVQFRNNKIYSGTLSRVFSSDIPNLKILDLSSSEFYGCSMYGTFAEAGKSATTPILNVKLYGTKFIDCTGAGLFNSSVIQSINIDRTYAKCNNLSASFSSCILPSSITITEDQIGIISDGSFSSTTGITSLNIEQFQTFIPVNRLMQISTVTNVNFKNIGDLNLDRSFVTCPSLTTVTFSKVHKITNLNQAFSDSALTKIDFTLVDLSTCYKMNSAFSKCTQLTEVKMSGPLSPYVDVTNMFADVTTTGTFYYDGNYDYSKIIAVLPETWTAVDTSAQ